MPAKSIMIQGTGSDVGKSIIAAALCRILSEDGYRVAPFKSQNMALNSYVTKDGFEMGRAQVVQAEAAGVDPMVEMNPILLKPMGDSRSQVVVMGKPFKNMSAKEYYKDRGQFIDIIKDAYEVLQNKFDVIVIEGAGSPAEINIKERDIVNMNMAKMADAPVLLVTDIDRGGSFAWIVGTLQLLTEEERARVAGVIFNKFRGDIEILKPGYEMLNKIIHKPVLGTLPFMDDVHIDDEDSVALDNIKKFSISNGSNDNCDNKLDIVVIKLPKISNFTDFDSLNKDPNVLLRYVNETSEFGNPDLVIIPGTKGTINDLKFLKDGGFTDSIKKNLNSGCMIIGICGGYQMLGSEIKDPLHVESSEDVVVGLGLINAVTEFAAEKTTHQTKGKIVPGSLPFEVKDDVVGYEIHMGTTQLLDLSSPNNRDNLKSNKTITSSFLNISERSSKPVNIEDGISIFNEKQFIIGTYMHGIFDNDNFRLALIKYLAAKRGKILEFDTTSINTIKEKDDNYKRLADITRASLDMDYIYKIINL